MKLLPGMVVEKGLGGVRWLCVVGIEHPDFSTGETVERSYTPVDTLEANKKRNGFPVGLEGETIELMVKLYKDGKMSSFLSNLNKGRWQGQFVGSQGFFFCKAGHHLSSLGPASNNRQLLYERLPPSPPSSPGDTVEVSDPDGTFDAPNRLPPASKILMVAAGSGK